MRWWILEVSKAGCGYRACSGHSWLRSRHSSTARILLVTRVVYRRLAAITLQRVAPSSYFSSLSAADFWWAHPTDLPGNDLNDRHATGAAVMFALTWLVGGPKSWRVVLELACASLVLSPSSSRRRWFNAGKNERIVRRNPGSTGCGPFRRIDGSRPGGPAIGD